MRDPETMRIALAAAGDGPPRLLDRPHDRRRLDGLAHRRLVSRPSGRTRSARSCRWRWRRSLTQTLLPRKGGGRVAAAELLFVGYGARQHIRKNALQHLHQEIAITRKQGSITLEESLAKLARDGVVDLDEARARAAHPEEFENYFRGSA